MVPSQLSEHIPGISVLFAFLENTCLHHDLYLNSMCCAQCLTFRASPVPLNFMVPSQLSEHIPDVSVLFAFLENTLLRITICTLIQCVVRNVFLLRLLLFLLPDTDATYPKDFKKTAMTIFKRLFRVFAIIYCSHFDNIEQLGAAAHLNTSFKVHLLP